MQVIDAFKAPSVTFRNMLKILNLLVVAKEINGCYGRTMVAMVTNIELLED